jgi:hypothetical protein
MHIVDIISNKWLKPFAADNNKYNYENNERNKIIKKYIIIP